MIAVSLPPPVQADMARAQTVNWSPEDVHELDAIIERLTAYYVEQMDARDHCGLDPLDSEMQANAVILGDVLAATAMLQSIIDALNAHAEECA